jgi:integrase
MSMSQFHASGASARHVFPNQGTLIDLAGRPTDASSWNWRLNSPTQRIILKWARVKFRAPDLLEATVQFCAELVRYRSPSSVENWFDELVNFSEIVQLRGEDAAGSIITFASFSDWMNKLGPSGRHRVRMLRDWYVWCCDRGYAHFDADVAIRLAETIFGGAAKGQTVLSLDPDEGPLVDTEVVALLNALRAAEEGGHLSLQERVAVWLCLALGANASQYVLLRDGDLEQFHGESGGQSLYQLNVARVKKRFKQERFNFKARKLVPELGESIKELLKQNRQRCSVEFQNSEHTSIAVPLFMRKAVGATVLPKILREYGASMTNNEFTRMVAEAVEKLGVISPRTGRALRVTTRRFRYTFATRLVREGASQRVVAEALDHTDLQHVQVYFDLKSDVVEKLDAAMAMALGPLSQAFLGHLVRGEHEAVRGNTNASRIYHHERGLNGVQAIGTCGSFSFCGLTAPIACYTCVKFQPWIEAPHESVLQDLVAERERRQATGLDGKMVALFDPTILAVADVVSRAAAARKAA